MEKIREDKIREKIRLDYRDSAGYSAGYAETSAPPRAQPNYLVRYVPRSIGLEKQACNAPPVFLEQGSRADADGYVAGLIHGGHAEWGSIEIFENTHAIIRVDVSYNQPSPIPPRGY